MKICIKVAWPVHHTVCLPRSNHLAEKLKKKKSKLRQDLVCFTEEGPLISGLFGDKNRVPDVDRYEIVRCGDGIAIKDHRWTRDNNYVSTNPYVDRPPASNSGQAPATLVIVLESPHRDEYGCSVEKPIAPARGQTGARMHKHLGKVLKSCPQLQNLLRKCAPVRVVISNPVPFQTSAYAIHGGRLSKTTGDKLRNFIWPALWELEEPNPKNDAKPRRVLQREFCKRLQGYNPVAIVNACTLIGKPKVTKILRVTCNVHLYEADHPSVWKSSTKLTRICPHSTGNDPK